MTHILPGSPKPSIVLDARLPRIAHGQELNLPRITLDRGLQVPDSRLAMIGLVTGLRQIVRTLQAGPRLPGAQDHEHSPRRLVRLAAAALIHPAALYLRIAPQLRVDASYLGSRNEHPTYHVCNSLAGRR